MEYYQENEIEQELSLRRNVVLIALVVLGLLFVCLGVWLLMGAEPRRDNPVEEVTHEGS